MSGVLLHGFCVAQFRSFGEAPQFVGPLSKVSVVCGLNNDGKSNVLLAAQSLMPRVVRSATALDDLDVPGQRADPANWHFVTGVAVPVGSDRTQWLIDNLSSAGSGGGVSAQRGTPLWDAFDHLAHMSALAPPEGATINGGDNHIWLLVVVGNSQGYEPFGPQLEQFTSELGSVFAYELSMYLTNAASSTDVQQNSWTILSSLMTSLFHAASIPRVVLIPATRSIADGEASSMPSVDGHGLPNWLLRLQSPSVAEHRTARERFEAINEFVRDVLDRPDATIWVPHDSQEIYLGLRDSVLPLRNLGTGISQTLLIATIATTYSRHLICLEEPELHLHPTLLRRLMAYLHDRTDNQYLISTHSAAILDDPRTTVLRASGDSNGETLIETVATNGDRAQLVQSLGYRASDLLQANCVIWVEGPSDRLYFLDWLRHFGSADLVEGVHFSVMFFGGGLMAHLSGRDIDEVDPEDEAEQWINLLRLNRNMAMIVDSDAGSADDQIGATKLRLRQEFADRHLPFVVTAGRTVENYVPLEILGEAVRRAHKKVGKNWIAPADEWAPPLAGVEHPNKVRIAREVLALSPDWSRLNLDEEMRSLIAFIGKSQASVSEVIQGHE